MKLLLIFLLNLSLIASIHANDPETVIKDIFSRAQKGNALKNKADKEFIDAQFNFQRMSHDILGQLKKDRSQEDLLWFEKTIKDIITMTVYPKAPDFLKDVKITYKRTLVDQDKATVFSSVFKKGEVTSVDYQLLKQGNDWKVIDVALDEDSWVKTINEKMMKSFKEKGWNGVKSMLNKKLTELKKKK